MPDEKEIKIPTPIPMEVIASPEKNIPKFSNRLAVARSEKDNIVLFFMAQNESTTPPILIETIMVDFEQAKKIVEALNSTINFIPNDRPDTSKN